MKKLILAWMLVLITTAGFGATLSTIKPDTKPAAKVTLDDTGNNTTETEVESAIAELYDTVEGLGGGKSHYVKTSSGSLSAVEVTNSIISNSGQTETMTLTLPAPAESYSFVYNTVVPVRTTYIKAADGTYINFDGMDLDAADKIANAGAASEKGDCIVFLCAYDGSAWYWIARTITGDFTDGGQ